MELIDILRHSEEPKTEHYVEIPREYGKLRLDIPGDVGIALSQAGMTEETSQKARQLIDQAWAKYQAGDQKAAQDALLDVVKLYPYSEEAYGRLYDLTYSAGDLPNAEYYIKQAIALDPSYYNISLLGSVLGRQGKYDEASLLQEHLWETRSGAPKNEVLQAALDYLVTLSRQTQANKMLEVAVQAITELGGETRLVYQYILACVLLNDIARAKNLLAEVVPKLDQSDPVYPKFVQMQQVLDQQYPSVHGKPVKM